MTETIYPMSFDRSNKIREPIPKNPSDPAKPLTIPMTAGDNGLPTVSIRQQPGQFV